MLAVQPDDNQPQNELEKTEGGVEEGFGRVAGCGRVVEGEHFVG